MFELGWKSFKENKWLFVQVSLLYFLVSIVPSIIDFISNMGNIADDPIFKVLSVVINIAFFILGLIIPIGYTYILLSVVDGVSVGVRDLFSTRGIFWKFLLASIVSSIMIAVGFFLLIIPGVFLTVSFIFWGYIVVDQKVSAIQSLKKSYHMTKGYRWRMLGFLAMAFLINIVGFILIGLGLLVTVPVTALALTHLYRHIRHQQSDVVSREDHTPTPVRLA